MHHVQVVMRSALQLAEELGATALLVITETGESFEELKRLRHTQRVILATPSEELFQRMLKEATESMLGVDFVDSEEHADAEMADTLVVRLLTRKSTHSEIVEEAVLRCVEKGLLHDRDVVVAVSSTTSCEACAIIYMEVRKESLDLALYRFLHEIEVRPEVFGAVLNIALEIGREGREGRMIGTAFLIGDAEEILKNSRQLILNPFQGHVMGERSVLNPEIKESIKELAQLDGVFVISKDGVIESAGVYLTVDTSGVDIPRGLGSRHAAVAATTAKMRCVGITVSQSGGIVRVFKDGRVVLTIEPQRRFCMRGHM